MRKNTTADQSAFRGDESSIMLTSYSMKHLLRYSAVLLFFAAPLQAAPVPDAGSILRDQQIKPQPQQQLPSVEAEKKRTATMESGASVIVNSFTFSGYEGIATIAELKALVAGVEGKKLSFSELEAEAEKVTAYLKKKGWFLARAYLPKQDVTSGIIEIAVIQGKSDGNLTIKHDNPVRISENRVRGFTRGAVKEGKAINDKDLERSVLLLSDLPGISAKASLASGAVPGTSGVEVAVTEGSVLSGSVWTDNQGNRYTGAWRANTMISVNDPYGSGDQITLLLTSASWLDQGRIGYALPLGFSGLKGNVSWTGMRYELGSDLASLNYTGQSNSIDAGLTYPFIRSRNTNLLTTLSAANRTLIDRQNGAEIHHKRSKSASLNTSVDNYDTIMGGGYSSLNIGLTAGSLKEVNPASVATANVGSFARLNVNVSRLQRLTKEFNLNLSAGAQLADDNLDSSEKFSLGGANGVRAYPVSEASGDEGQLLNAELRFTPPASSGWSNWQFIGFYDAGHISLQKHQVDLPGTATNLNSYWLRGAGMGFSWTIGRTAAIRGSWAQAIGENPGRSTAGNNSDGKSNKNRYWLQASISF